MRGGFVYHQTIQRPNAQSQAAQPDREPSPLANLFRRPDLSYPKTPLNETDKGFVEKLRRLIETNMANASVSVEDLGEQIGLSRTQLYRKTKALTGYSPNELLRIARLKKSGALLASTEKTISEITYEVGFTSPSYFTRCYKDYFGESPTDFLRRKKGE